MKKFFESNSFSLVVGMFEKYGSNEEVAIDFCNKLHDCEPSDDSISKILTSHDDYCKIFTEYNERVHAAALCFALGYLSIFEEEHDFNIVEGDCVEWCMDIFYWYKEHNSFRCFVDVECVDTDEIYEGIGKLLECGELYLEQDEEFGCLRICLNPNKEPVDTSRAFAIYNSLMYKPDFLGYAYNNTITMEEASRVIGAEIVKGNMDLIGVC